LHSECTAAQQDRHLNTSSLGSREMMKKLREGSMYLAIMKDLCSRRIVGWHTDKRMTTDRVNKALMKAYSLRQPPKGLVLHSDRGPQYNSKLFRKLLAGYGIRSSMGGVAACWDKTVVERFFGSLKHDWILNQHLKLGL